MGYPLENETRIATEMMSWRRLHYREEAKKDLTRVTRWWCLQEPGSLVIVSAQGCGERRYRVGGFLVGSWASNDEFEVELQA